MASALVAELRAEKSTMLLKQLAGPQAMVPDDKLTKDEQLLLCV